MDALPVEQPEQLPHKGGLQQGFPAGDGDAALVPKVHLVPADFLYQFRRLPLLAAGEIPGVRVVAVGAAQGAALQEHHVPHPGAVHRPQGLDGMHPPLHHRDTWKVREMTSRCCSRESL